MNELRCRKCDALLTRDDIGCTKKLINRGAEEYCCISCLAAHMGVTEDLLRKKIEEWRNYGCQLFQ